MKLMNPAEVLSGNRVFYQDVFKQSDVMAFRTETDRFYSIYDNYCMNPMCKCGDVILHIIEIHQCGDTKSSDFAVTYSFKNKKFEILEANEISMKQVKKIMERLIKNDENLFKLYKKRYQEMKDVGEESILAVKEEIEAKMELFQINKTERNSLCPCGSGKKYKKCCGIH